MVRAAETAGTCTYNATEAAVRKRTVHSRNAAEAAGRINTVHSYNATEAAGRQKNVHCPNNAACSLLESIAAYADPFQKGFLVIVPGDLAPRSLRNLEGTMPLGFFNLVFGNDSSLRKSLQCV